MEQNYKTARIENEIAMELVQELEKNDIKTVWSRQNGYVLVKISDSDLIVANQILNRIRKEYKAKLEFETKLNDLIPHQELLQDFKPKQNLSRPHQIITRVSDKERDLIKERVAASGLNQSEYARKMMLEGKVVGRKIPKELQESILTVLDLKAELGKIGGLLKSAIKPNLENHQLTSEDMELIRGEVAKLDELKAAIYDEVRKWQS